MFPKLPALAVVVAGASSILPAAVGLEWLGPRATRNPSLPEFGGFTPKPTNGPELAAVGFPDAGLKLFRRLHLSETDAVCGYVDANGAYPFSCTGLAQCAFNRTAEAFGCCTGGSTASDGAVYFSEEVCPLSMTSSCYNSDEAGACTGTCSLTATACSRSAEPLCRTVRVSSVVPSNPQTFTYFDCIPRGGKTDLLLDGSTTTSASETINLFQDPNYTFDGTTFVSIESSITTFDPVPPCPDCGKKESNAPAIAGGVVGGVVGLGLITAAVVFALKARKKRARREAGAIDEVAHTSYLHEGKNPG